ncbi:hypothetical protein [Chryseobacterium luquanense]|uniref:Uncharacterized protein n=1 Tax=Chryseobacterium luquanense TaxID=2983766 RepID=A0ABT3Y4H9_9FLAO|nr:hypothetical protein [Chryseobacterium luquanense]MCX8533043.1 hypothetical protein [Chryseobacterium luquanense]
MAAAKCNITFNIDYISSKPIQSATATYKHKISGATNVFSIVPVPLSGQSVHLPEISTPGDYELVITLTSEDGIDTTKTSSFKIGNCKGSGDGKVFWNHATIGDDTWKSKINFLIKKNEVVVVETTTAGVGYIDPIEQWESFTAQVGDKIEFSTNLITSGSKGNTIGNMFTYSTTGTTGMVNVMGPTALNPLLMNSQQIGPTNGTKRTFTFTVESGLNYALGTNYFQ